MHLVSEFLVVFPASSLSLPLSLLFNLFLSLSRALAHSFLASAFASAPPPLPFACASRVIISIRDCDANFYCFPFRRPAPPPPSRHDSVDSLVFFPSLSLFRSNLFLPFARLATRRILHHAKNARASISPRLARLARAANFGRENRETFVYRHDLFAVAKLIKVLRKKEPAAVKHA